MPPVNPSSTSDVDNEATAELPVLDVAAYEATLNQPVSHTDTWVLPTAAATAAVIPTLNPVDLEGTAEIPHRLDFSGTHEMPALPPFRKGDTVSRSARPAVKPTPPVAAAAAAAAAAVAVPVPVPVPAAAAPPAPRVPTGTTGTFALPPSPPLIEELRNALSAAERRITELDERLRIADAERGIAVDRANAEAAQLRQQLGQQFEKLSSARE